MEEQLVIKSERCYDRVGLRVDHVMSDVPRQFDTFTKEGFEFKF